MEAPGWGVAYLVSPQKWFLRFGAESRYMCLTVEDFTEWLPNRRPTWAAYRAIMGEWLIALDNHPGVSPVGVGYTWRRLMAS